MELAKRDDVPVELTWDLSLIYPTEEAMLADAQKMKELSLSMEASYKGNLTDAATINHCLDDYQEVYRLITLTANYCDLAVSVDYYNSANQTRNDRINSLISEIFSRLTFIESELSEQSEDVLNEAMQQSDTNRCYLAEILRNKAHRLSPETERAISALSQTFSAPYQIYNMAKLADMKFDSFTVNGTEYPLGYSLFEDNYEYEKDIDPPQCILRLFCKNQTVRKCNGSCLQCPAADRKDHGHAARLRFRHRFSAVPAAGQP